MKTYNFLIVGAGLFGATCAYELNKKGYSCLVIDSRNHIGGNIYTKEVDGINVHVYGAHIFHTSNKYIWDYVNQFAQFNNFINSPIAIYKNELYNLPFNMNTFSKLWSDVVTPSDAKRRIEEEKKENHFENPTNLEEQALSLVGETIYKKLIKGYTAKQWGKECTELPSFIIKRIPVRFTYDNNYFNDKYQGIPVGGYTKIIEKMLEGIDVRLDCDYFSHKEELDAISGKVIFTGPIDRFFDYKFGPLEYRSLRFENEILDTDNYQGNAVINYTDQNIPYTRTIEHKHFEPEAKSDKTIISKEYPSTWNVGDEPYYPINNDANNSLYERYLEESKKVKNIIFGGRLGNYKYFDMDDTIESALSLLDKVLN